MLEIIIAVFISVAVTAVVTAYIVFNYQKIGRASCRERVSASV